MSTEYKFSVFMDMLLMVKVDANSIDEAVEKVTLMSTDELLTHDLINIELVDFESED